MSEIAWDTETELIEPGKLAPRLVCMTTYDDRGFNDIFDRHGAVREMHNILTSSDEKIVGQNISYDVAVMMAACPDLVEPFFRAYEDNRIEDTMIREQLILIAEGRFKGWPDGTGKWRRPRFDLAGLTRKYAGYDLPKEDTWRLRYGELYDTPLEQWPTDAKTYALMDAKATYQVWQGQCSAEEYLPDRHNQYRFALWKHLTSCRGLITDPRSVLKFKQATERELEAVKGRLIEAGLVRKSGTRDTKAAQAYMVSVCEREGIPVRKTPADGIALDSDACEATDDHLLMDYANFTTLAAMLNKDVPMLVAGASKPIHTRYGIAESGRTTSSSNKVLGAGTGNLQNIRRGARRRKDETDEEFKKRKEEAGDIRECFIPRPGYVWIQADYPALELRTLAEVCSALFGHSKLADALNAGEDPHSRVASAILAKPYEWVIANKEDPEVDDARQTGKVANFGFPGGLGAAKLVLFARKSYRVNITEAQAKQLKYLWLHTFPEMEEFFDYINRTGEQITQLYSDRIRGGCRFCSACNTMFQGLGADASQYAGWLITKACFLDKSSALYNSRLVNYIHDEFHVETRLGPQAHDAAMEVSRLMTEGANKWLPHVPYKPGEIKSLLMARWSKFAKPVYNEEGRLIPWT